MSSFAISLQAKQLEDLSEKFSTEQAAHLQCQVELAELKAGSSLDKARLAELCTSANQQSLTEANLELVRLRAEIEQLKVMLADAQKDNKKLDSLLSRERSHCSLAKVDISALEQQLNEQSSRAGSCAEVVDDIGRMKGTVAGAKDRIAELEAALQSEQQAHQMAREDLERLETGLATEKTIQSVATGSFAAMEEELLTEKASHKLTKHELANTEAELEAERSNLTQAKMQLVRVEANLSSEKTNCSDLNMALEKLKVAQEKLKTELDTSRAMEKRSAESAIELRAQVQQDKQQLEGLKASHKQVNHAPTL